MTFYIFALSLVLALVLLPLLAWKWHIGMKEAVAGAIIIGGLSGLIVGWLDSLAAGQLDIAAVVLLELALIFLLTFIAIAVRFYRDPERTPPETEGVVLSPADGKVIYVNRVEGGVSLVSTKRGKSFRLEEIAATDLLAGAAYLIGIEMNILNVHVNRSPVGGKIVRQKHIAGKFMSLGKPESETMNERVTTVIDSGAFRVGIVQIASRLVRRIVSYLKEGDRVDIGQRLGMIRFGSQVDVALPAVEGLELGVSPGDRVRAGVSVIARYGETGSPVGSGQAGGEDLGGSG